MKFRKKKKEYLLRSFDLADKENIIKGKGVYLFTKKKKYFDTTSGLTGTAVLGWSNPEINKSINQQLKKISLIDYKYFLDENREKLAKLLINKTKTKLDKFFFVGGSGGEACEAAMKLSYQYHCATGNAKKKWFISRKQSYHGSGSDAISVGDRPNLNIYKPFFPKFRAKINEHNVFRQKKKNETIEDYENRSVKELEVKILTIGAENVAGFVAETIMGGLVGDVPPTKNYWKKIRKLCDNYKVHLILDEVWCGTGTTGKTFSVEWDKITPDFIFMGKTLAAGYLPVSGIATKSSIGEIIKKKQGSIQFSTTHQGHSLGVAAALQAQTIINKKEFLNKVIQKGNFLRNTLSNELAGHDFFYNVRGRGLRNSLEYKCKDQHLFGIALTNLAKKKYNMLISAKWHRVCFSQAINIKNNELEFMLAKFIDCFKEVSSNWTKKNISKIKFRSFY
jgi:adenosylmethionine-8-amino-7-oxononanoate aminotransferase